MPKHKYLAIRDEVQKKDYKMEANWVRNATI